MLHIYLSCICYFETKGYIAYTDTVIGVGILVCNFTKKRNSLLPFFKCVCVFFRFFRFSEMFNQIAVLRIRLNSLKNICESV